MKLKQLGLINWANLENRDYSFADINLISGSSGAGKTTLLDALQTVMTAAAHNIVHYNPGQDEATQQSRSKETRSLASYILGCDDGKYSRLKPSCGYILAVFCPEQGEDSQAFTALVGVSARIDTVGARRTAKSIDEVYCVVRGVELDVDTLLVDENGSKGIVLLEQLVTHLQQKFRDIKIEPATGKEEYLRQLYGAFQGKKLAHKLEARNAAKQLVKFMAYKPEANLDLFVRNAILEPRDMSEAIDQVQNMMKTIHTMEQDAILIEQGIGLLGKSNKHITALIQSQLNEQTAKYEHHYREAYRQRELYTQENKKIKAHQQEITEYNEQIHQLSAVRRQLQDSLRQYEAKKQGIQALQMQEQLEKEKADTEDKITTASRSLLEQNSKRRGYRQKLDAVYQSIHKTHFWTPETPFNWSDAIKHIREQDDWDNLNLSEYLNDVEKSRELKGAAINITNLYGEFSDEIGKAKNEIFTQYLQSGSDLESKQRRFNKLDKEIAHMQEANRVVYREDTERALRLIRERLPQANAQVVCDHVEVLDPDWQMAIEAFMGENRFLIVVDQEHEIAALNLAESQGLKSALVQGTKALNDARKKTLSENSIYELTEFSHETVRAYFRCAYGDVLQVNDPEKLRTTRRGLMRDGRASTSYKLFVARINDDDLKLGKEARQRALNAKRSQLKQLDDQIQLAEMRKRSMQSWHSLLDQTVDIDLAVSLTIIVEANDRLQRVQEQIDNLDLSDFEDLLAEINKAQQQLDEVDNSISESNKTIGTLENKIESGQIKLGQYEKNAEKEDAQAVLEQQLLENMSKYYPDLDLDDTLEQIEVALDTNNAIYKLTDPEPLARSQSALFNSINDNLSQFNLMNLQNIKIRFDAFKETAKSGERYDIVMGFASTADVQRQVSIAHNTLQNNILAAHKQNLQEISQSFNKTFISHLCHTLHNYIEQGKQQLESLNQKLKHHIFGEEHYEFAYEWVPEFKEYSRFLKEATHINMESDGGLFGEQQLSDESQDVFEKIKSLLLSEDLEQSKKELKRITDYRNFRTYDIFKVLPDPANADVPHKISLKSYGTGSGGQMETPSYVIRAAALSSALKLDVTRSNLKTLMIDESFGKMDEARSKAILKYLNQTLGYQILFVIPSKSSGPFHDVVDQVIEITKVESGAPRGELHTQVHVSTNVINKERVNQLWQQEKIQIRNQASLFDFDELDEKTANAQYRTLQ